MICSLVAPGASADLVHFMPAVAAYREKYGVA
jgi:hypothetical protein